MIIKNSDHLKAKAIDFRSPAFGTVFEIAKALEPQINYLGIGQLINEGRFTDAKIHIGTAREFFPQEEKELEKLAEKIKATP